MKKGVGKIILGVAIFFLTIILPGITIVTIVLNREDGTKLLAPGIIEINIAEAGQYSLYNNFSTVYQGKSYSDSEELPGGMTFSLTNCNTGKIVPMQTGLTSKTTIGNEKSKSVGYFEITTPGKYTLSVTGSMQPRIFTFNKSRPVVFYGFVLIGVFILAMICFIVGSVLIILGALNLTKGRQVSAITSPPVKPPSASEGDYISKDYRD